MLRNKFVAFIAFAGFMFANAPANAHFPVSLSAQDRSLTSSKVLVDGSISYAVTANFSKANQTRFFRFTLDESSPLNIEYLIVDTAPTNRLKRALLPEVSLTTPAGKRIALTPKERTAFYEPYGKRNYFYLARYSAAGQAGVYSVTVRSKSKSSAVIAVGRSEVPGEVLQIGVANKQCPVFVKDETEISQSRANQLIGMSEKAAMACAQVNKWRFRVGQRDGESFGLTMDYLTNRVTVSVESDSITEVNVG